MNSEK